MLIKISKNWLEEYVKINDSDEKLVEDLSISGTLVENFHNSLSGVVVAKIEKIQKHPNADKLFLVDVYVRKTKRTIVCGANNIKVGQIVPLALPGAIISGTEIKETEIRGIKSSGMLCSAFELGIGDDRNGIMILDESYKIGELLSNHIHTDTIFDLEITPNRGDCLSHLGVAREIAVLKNSNIFRKPIELKMISKKISESLSLQVEANDLCSTYLARVVEGVKITESPRWLRDRLVSCGITPLNNIVDITNYIMLDLGQPMHAFDLDKIEDNKIIVRRTDNNESITSFDGTNIDLEKDDLIIADGKKPIAVAGIIGGIDSGISDNTTSIVLEAASFSAKSIRATSKRLGIKTDASMRFERGVDPNIALYAIDKAAKMISEICGGKILSGVLKHKNNSEEIKIKLESQKINDLLGTTISEKDMIEILKRLGFRYQKDFIIVPSWRPDVTIWQDISEEIIRIYGLNNLLPAPIKATKITSNSEYVCKEFIKDILVSSGFSECFNYSFISEKESELFGISKKNLVEVENPLAPENRYMRNSLMPGLLKNVAKNSSFDRVFLFEIGKVFNKLNEHFSLGVIASGKGARDAINDLVSNYQRIINQEIEVLELSKEYLLKYKIKKTSVCFFEINLTEISKKFKNINKLKLSDIESRTNYRDVSKYPSIVRDLAFILAKNIDSKKVEEAIKNGSNYVIISELFDEFMSDKLGKNKKNLAYHIHLQAEDRTLKDAEANIEISTIIKTVEKQFSAKLRNY